MSESSIDCDLVLDFLLNDVGRLARLETLDLVLDDVRSQETLREGLPLLLSRVSWHSQHAAPADAAKAVISEILRKKPGNTPKT